MREDGEGARAGKKTREWREVKRTMLLRLGGAQPLR